MSLFDWLLVGHLVGDWLFQNHWMAAQKRKSWLNAAIISHCCVYTVAVMVALWLGAPEPLEWQAFAIAASIVFVSHWLIDVSQLVDQWSHVLLQSELPFVRIMADQTFHVLVLVAVVYIFG